jgi:hypothetical protein
MLKKIRIRAQLRRSGKNRCRCGGGVRITIHRSGAISADCRRCGAPQIRWDRW